MKSGDRDALNPSEGRALEKSIHDIRRSTRLPLRIPIEIISLDAAQSFSGKYETAVVSAHGCGVLIPGRLEKGTPVVVQLISNSHTRNARVVTAISIEGTSSLLGLEFDTPASDFWQVENPPADWL